MMIDDNDIYCDEAITIRVIDTENNDNRYHDYVTIIISNDY